ncbi:MAG: type I methionyl aminopeptidase [Clostridia bacterium]|nr:type I methionyl aminopeptidase [Clostridia bacterium]
MILLKNQQQIQLMREANQVVKQTLQLLCENCKPGVSTYELNKLAHDFIIKCGAKPSFLNYCGYPASVCISIDDEVVHGIPSKKRFIEEGQIVSFDVGAILKGWHGDAARTVAVGYVDDQKQKLMEVTKQAFFEGVNSIVIGKTTIGDLGHTIQTYAESFGYGVVKELVGHGIGRQMHEDPSVPNYGTKGHGMKLVEGMTIAVEPMINAGTDKVIFMPDGWTVKTLDGKPSAHYENTIALTKNGVEILSL